MKNAEAKKRHINHVMKQISEELSNFVKDIVKEMGLENQFYYRIDLDGKNFFLYLFNSENNVVAGKAYPYLELVNLCRERKVEFEFNRLVRQMIIKSSTGQGTLTMLKGIKIVDPKNVLWM